MRLLTRSEIHVAQQSDRAREIEEGKKLAKSVDRLRQVRADEEQSLTKFRRETLAKIHEEITQESEKLGNLKKQVYELEERRKEAKAPLDKEIRAIEEGREELKRLREEVARKELAIEGGWQRVVAEQRLVAIERGRAATERADSSRLLKEASKDKEEAGKLLKLAKLAEKQAKIKKDSLEKELRRRDMYMAARERDCTMKEETLEKERAALDLEWKKLADRKERLERTIKLRNK